MSAPLVVNTKDGTVWWRQTRDGVALYAIEREAGGCPAEALATYADLVERGLAGEAFALPMPTGTGRRRPTVEESADRLTAMFAPTQALTATGSVCRCDEPGADPYACEADDCTAYFPELDPFGGSSRPVNEADAKVSAKCGQCPWRSSVWHVDDGSAEAELYEHSTTMHGAEGGAS
ncbi:hypothetical protein [Streptomyces sp. NPDC016845]|uniref:hypothetical protein n=1 Tax=Streptomyces sp. NPDC016845 TaxID=3364972 RepID=UPI0037899E0C